MASYQSIPDVSNEYQSPINIGLVNQALSVNQQKYDTGLQTYQNNLAQLKVQENLLVREEDKERFSQNVQGLINEINKNGKVNWAKSGLTNKINAYTNSAIDDYTVEQIGISQNIRNFEATVAQKREKNDGSYSDINYSFARTQAGVDDYLKGVDAQGNKIDKIGNLQYINYIDVNKSALEKVKAFKDLKGEETIEVPFTDSDGTRRMRTTTIKGLTESEILAYMPQVLSPEENRQLQINGWAKYQGPDGLKVAKESFKSFTNNITSNFDRNISRFTADYNNKNISQGQREEAYRNKIAEEANKKQYLENLNNINTENPASIGGFLETMNWKTNFAKMAGAKTSITYDTDDAFYDAQELELKISAEKRAIVKDTLEIEKLKKELIPETTEGNTISLANIPAENVDETNPYDTLVKDFNTENSSIVSFAQSTLNGGGVDENTKKSYNSAYEEIIKQGYAPSTAAKEAFKRSGLDNLFPEQYSQILESYARRNDMASVIKAADESTIDVFKQNPDKYITSLKTALNSAKFAGQSETFENVENLGKDALKKANMAEDFVNNNGGWNKIKENLLKNPKLILQFEKQLDILKDRENSMADTFLNPGVSFRTISSLNEDSIAKRNEIVAAKGKGIVTTAAIGTVVDKDLRKKIINSIPQKEGTVPFDVEKGLTVKRTPEGTFQLIQSGAKEGVNGMFGSTRTYEAKKGDDLYKLLNSQILNEAKSREVKAGNYTTAINNENIEYLEKNHAIKASNFIINTLGANFQMDSKVNPSFFLTKRTTEEVYKQRLKEIIAPEKIETLTKLMSQNTYSKFIVSATPIQGQWNTSVSLKKGGAPFLLKEAETSKQNMDRQLLLFVKQYPQILIGEAILEYLQENPKEIDTVLSRLK